MSERTVTIERLLGQALDPTELLVKDQSHLHAGHAGAKDGKGHFDVRIVSDKFAGQSRINRHRMVYDALGAFMQSDIHALRITALTSSDR
ncbi:MAG: BolA family protein [Woeseiaceae bacterium]